MNCLIIGYGSIGARHAFILEKLGCSVSVVTKRDIDDFQYYKTIELALLDKNFDYTVICNETSKHYQSLIELDRLGYCGKILIEKPLFSEIHPLPNIRSKDIFVAYNLRFHPVIRELNNLVKGKSLYSIQIYTGKYLPDWRTGTDYTKCYSASKDLGGGVLNDLSHELDYLNLIAGRWKRIAAIGGKFSGLRIDSDDNYALLIETENCPVVNVQMNYLDQRARREMIINLEDCSIRADLILNTLEVNDKIKKFKIGENFTYILQHKAIRDGDYDYVCTLEEGMEILRLIDAAKLAAGKQIWISRIEQGEFS